MESSTGDHYEVAYKLSKKGEIFELRWPWKVKDTNRNLRCGISCKRYEIESSHQQNTIIKLHTGFLKKLEFVTFDDSEKLRSLTDILDAESLGNGTR